MVIFNTNQARHLYVATSVGQIKDADVNTDVTSGMSNGGLKVGAIKNGSEYEDLYFVYKNGDGIITRSDAIKIANIQYMNWVDKDKLKIALNKVTVALDTTKYANVAALAGKTIILNVNLREFIGLEDSENYPIPVAVPAVTSSAANFYAALESALNSAIKGFKTAPFTVSSSANGLVITEAAQKWVRGKFSADPIHFDVSTYVSEDAAEWASITKAATSTYVSGDFKIADLEYFTHRERAEIMGEVAWPNNYEWTPLVNPVAGTFTYDLLTIQYFYAGEAEDIQKSPRTIHIAVAHSSAATLKGYIDAFLAPATGSGSGA